MDTKKVFDILDIDIRLNYNSKSEFAKKVGLSRQVLNDNLKVLKTCNKKNSFNKICSILEKAGYEITIRKKGG